MAGGIDLGVDHPRQRLRRRLLGFQPLDLRVAAQPIDRRPHRFPAHRPGRRVGRRLHHVGAAEDRFLTGQMGGKIVEPSRQLPDRFPRNLYLMSSDRGDQGLALGEPFGLLAPPPVPDFGVVVVRLAGARQFVHAGHPGCVAERRDTQFSGPRDDRLAPLRPECLQVLRHPVDPGELAVGTVLLHAQAEILLKIPGEVCPEQRTGRLLPAVDRVLVVRPPLAVFARPRKVEYRAMHMKLGVVLAAGAVDEGGAHQLRFYGTDDAVLTDTRVAAILQHRVFERRAGGGYSYCLDPLTHVGLGDGPQRGHAFVHGEGQVDAGRAVGIAGPLHQLAGPVRREAVVEAAELASVHLSSVLKAKQALGIEPGAVRLLARRVVLVGMTEGALALKIVLGRGHLADGGYHRDAAPVLRRLAVKCIGGVFNTPGATWISNPGLNRPRMGLSGIDWRAVLAPSWPYPPLLNPPQASACTGVRRRDLHYAVLPEQITNISGFGMQAQYVAIVCRDMSI